MAGSTAGWWPSDRDRFPPRFLLPPSLQTHNCIISTHLASSSLPAFPRLTPVLSFFSLSPSLSLFLFLFLLRLPTLRSPLFTIRPGVRLRALASLSSSCPTSPTDRFSISLFLSLVAVIHFVSSLLSHESVATRAKRPTTFFVPRCFTPRRRYDVYDALFSLAPFSPLALSSSYLLLSFSLSFSPSHLAKREVMPRIRFFILLPLPPSSRSFSSFSLYLVVRSVIELAIFTKGHATIYPIQRRGQSAGEKDGTRR